MLFIFFSLRYFKLFIDVKEFKIGIFVNGILELELKLI